jgi:hypothetical protein
MPISKRAVLVSLRSSIACMFQDGMACAVIEMVPPEVARLHSQHMSLNS